VTPPAHPPTLSLGLHCVRRRRRVSHHVIVHADAQGHTSIGTFISTVFPWLSILHAPPVNNSPPYSDWSSGGFQPKFIGFNSSGTQSFTIRKTNLSVIGRVQRWTELPSTPLKPNGGWKSVCSDWEKPDYQMKHKLYIKWLVWDAQQPRLRGLSLFRWLPFNS